MKAGALPERDVIRKFYRQGIPFIIARTWGEGDRTVERNVKNLKNARLLSRLANHVVNPEVLKQENLRSKLTSR